MSSRYECMKSKWTKIYLSFHLIFLLSVKIPRDFLSGRLFLLLINDQLCSFHHKTKSACSLILKFDLYFLCKIMHFLENLSKTHLFSGITITPSTPSPRRHQELEDPSFELHLSKDSWKTTLEGDDDVDMAESKDARSY